ncbi:MAG: nicotinate-nucleotide adenylyltransferase [Sporolactobacillus sp.]|jgi:nicotinate-nucleotide adenylyltransferase|nr:nicotinate-nucleotide adenylyltransferase [Sporolactobacillus sp.]MCI1882214.1 nicotinate-nucleotide adenylyltransferase [Sporolactobacillus sp.]
MSRKIGILGGTFDPPHLMHLLIAQEALEVCGLDEVWFLPSYIPPHAAGKVAVSAPEDRVELVRRAIAGNDRFHVSMAEIKRKGKSYTVDTMRQFRRSRPNVHFYFILGADMVDDLPTWHGIAELIRLTSFIGFRRPGFAAANPAGADVAYIDLPMIDISSSMLRERLKNGRSCRYFLPDAVLEYIKRRRLYED